jgi:hypothetical protein
MWYSVRGKEGFRENIEQSYRIKCAVSENFLSWDRIDDYDLLPTGNEKDWDGFMTCYPNVVEWEGEWYMFYNGNGFGKTGIGYAKWIMS